MSLVDELLADFPPATTDPVTFLGAQYDLGLAWVHFPEGFGGLGLPRELQKLVTERLLAAAGAPHPGMPQPDRLSAWAPRPSYARGTDEQKRRYLRPLFTGEEVWCQLFSEPGAGSRRGRARHPGGARRRRVGRQRPEGVDDAGAHVAAGACSSPAPTPTRPSTRG